MQTFLPSTTFKQSAFELDNRRLSNQRNENYIILDTIFKETMMPNLPRPKAPEGIWIPGRTKDYKQLPWRNHPVVKMWRPYRWALLAYAYEIENEHIARGFENNTRIKLERFGYYRSQELLVEDEIKQKERHDFLPDVYPLIELIPWWLGNSFLHASHRSNLLEKDPKFYSRYNWEEEPGMAYYWPA